MKAISVGSIVEAKCGKCNDVMGHAVVLMEAGIITKVECRVCHSIHKFRAAGTSLAASAPEAVRKSRAAAPTPRAPRAGTAAKPKVNALREQWEAMQRKRAGEETLPYSSTTVFPVKSLVEHPLFGIGEVTALVPPGKMDILFEDGVKRLLCGK